MTNQIVNIVEFSILHDILDEIKSIFSFKISNFSNTQDFLNHENNKDLDDSNVHPSWIDVWINPSIDYDEIRLPDRNFFIYACI